MWASAKNTADPDQDAILSSQPLGPILPRPCQRLPRGSRPDSHQQEDASLLPDRAHAPPRTRLLPRRGAHTLTHTSTTHHPHPHSTLRSKPAKQKPGKRPTRPLIGKKQTDYARNTPPKSRSSSASNATGSVPSPKLSSTAP